jgi:hypothetical protein
MLTVRIAHQKGQVEDFMRLVDATQLDTFRPNH